MEYAQKHKNIIARLFKKAKMGREAEIILSSDEYDFEMSNAIRRARTILNCKGVNQEELLDAVRRYENRECLVFKECHRKRCEGGVWCNIYNLGGSHGCVGMQFEHLGRHIGDVPKGELERELCLRCW